MLAALATRALGAMPWLPSAWNWIKLGAFGLLVMLCAWLLHDNGRLARERDDERAAHALTMARYQMAQDVAERVATENKLRKETADETARQTADADLDVLRARYRAAIGQLRRQAAPLERAPGTADLPGTGQAAQGTDGPGAGAGVSRLAISADDALICADNTARLQVARDWALRVQD